MNFSGAVLANLSFLPQINQWLGVTIGSEGYSCQTWSHLHHNISYIVSHTFFFTFGEGSETVWNKNKMWNQKVLTCPGINMAASLLPFTFTVLEHEWGWAKVSSKVVFCLLNYFLVSVNSVRTLSTLSSSTCTLVPSPASWCLGLGSKPWVHRVSLQPSLQTPLWLLLTWALHGSWNWSTIHWGLWMVLPAFGTAHSALVLQHCTSQVRAQPSLWSHSAPSLLPLT